MSEIKSTLELALEKTKHLTLSEEEKQKQRKDEFAQKLRGILQKYRNHLVKQDRTKESLLALQKEYGFDYKKALITATLDLIRFDDDNEPLFEILESVCNAETSNLRTLCKDYQQRIASAVHKTLTQAKNALDKNYGISGSAVLPNVEQEESLKGETENLYDQFTLDLKRCAQKLIEVC